MCNPGKLVDGGIQFETIICQITSPTRASAYYSQNYPAIDSLNTIKHLRMETGKQSNYQTGLRETPYDDRTARQRKTLLGAFGTVLFPALYRPQLDRSSSIVIIHDGWVVTDTDSQIWRYGDGSKYNLVTQSAIGARNYWARINNKTKIADCIKKEQNIGLKL